MTTSRPASDLAPGIRIGHRVVVSGPEYRPVGKQGQHAPHWLTRCDCGLEAWVQDQALRAGAAGSCRPCSNRRRHNHKTTEQVK